MRALPAIFALSIFAFFSSNEYIFISFQVQKFLKISINANKPIAHAIGRFARTSVNSCHRDYRNLFFSMDFILIKKRINEFRLFRQRVFLPCLTSAATSSKTENTRPSRTNYGEADIRRYSWSVANAIESAGVPLLPLVAYHEEQLNCNRIGRSSPFSPATSAVERIVIDNVRFQSNVAIAISA